MRIPLLVVVLVLLTVGPPAKAERAAIPQPLRIGAVHDCNLTDGTSLLFDGREFSAKAEKEDIHLQIRIFKTELEMTVRSPFTAEIYTEKDLILSRSVDGQSLFATYRAPVGNVVSLALHVLKDGTVIFTQSKTYQVAAAPKPNLYQSMTSGRCRQL